MWRCIILLTFRCSDDFSPPPILKLLYVIWSLSSSPRRGKLDFLQVCQATSSTWSYFTLPFPRHSSSVGPRSETAGEPSRALTFVLFGDVLLRSTYQSSSWLPPLFSSPLPTGEIFIFRLPLLGDRPLGQHTGAIWQEWSTERPHAAPRWLRGPGGGRTCTHITGNRLGNVRPAGAISKFMSERSHKWGDVLLYQAVLNESSTFSGVESPFIQAL